MMFANRIFREEVAMLVQEIAKEVAEDYQAEVTTESTLDLEEVDKQYRPVDSVTVKWILFLQVNSLLKLLGRIR